MPIMPARLPHEIFDLIIDHLHDDYQMLKTCSLVSKSCLTSARYHLFSCVYFKNYADLECIERWMSSPHLSQLVQRIFIGRGTRFATKFSSMATYSFVTEFHDDPLRWQSLLQIVTLFPQITSLKLDFVKFDTQLDAFRLVAGFSRLRRLQWINVGFKHLTQDVTDKITPPSFLCDLYITCHYGSGDIEQFLKWLTSCRRRIRLKALAIRWSIEPTHLIPFLTSWGTTLIALDLSGVSRRIDSYHVGSMTSLHAIRLPLIHLRRSHSAEDSYQWVYHILSSISSPNIRTISLPLELYYDTSDDSDDDDGDGDGTDTLELSMLHQLERIDWTHIDQLLVGIQSRTSLERIVVLMELVETDFPTASRITRRLLRGCIAGGLVVETRLWNAADLDQDF